MTDLKRWLITNRIYASLFILIGIFAYLDAMQIITFHTINTQQAWDLFNNFTGPAIWMTWYLSIVAIGIVYFWLTKDRSEALGIVVAGLLLLWFAAEDVLFFLFSKQPMTQCMQWFNDLNPQLTWWSTTIFKETCVSPQALTSFAILGVIISYFTFNKLKKAKW